MYFVKNELAVDQVSCFCLHVSSALEYEASPVVLVLQIGIIYILLLSTFEESLNNVMGQGNKKQKK